MIASHGIIQSGAGASIDLPLTLSELNEWWDFRTLNALSNGDPISSWVGRKNLYTLTQSGTARPSWATDDGDGHAAVQLDGVNDDLRAAVNSGSLYSGSGVYEVWMQVRGNGSGDATLWSTGGAVNTINVFAQKAYPRLFSYVRAGSEYACTNAGDVQDNGWHLLRFVKNGTTVKFILDGVDLSLALNAATISWTAESQTLYLGSGTGVSQFWAGGIRHALFFNGLLDSTDAAALTTFLGGAL